MPSEHDAKEQSATERFLRLAREVHISPELGLASLRVEKARRRLLLLWGGRALREYEVIIGRSPLGHKEREGDQRTPVGRYAICYRNPRSRFHLFLGLNYPNEADALAGLARGQIDTAPCQRIADAIRRGECPDWHTPLGGEVGIHGGGVDRPGTLGCIAMRNEDVEEVWGATCLGTSVDIVE
jgi:murein L,D-transpeptidase YafK